MIKKQVLRDKNPNLISIAPMLDYTDVFFRLFFRHISTHTMLYTEMLPTGAVLHQPSSFLKNQRTRGPLTAQLGGSNPRELAECAYRLEQAGFDGVNLNAGCPSERVQAGSFGATLMKNPALIADCYQAMATKVKIPVSIKTRLGFIGEDLMEKTDNLTRILYQAGCRHLIFHARPAALNKSPKENRQNLPLHYDIVYKIKEKYPDLFITLNGSVLSHETLQTHLQHVDGVMIGRWAYGNPYALCTLDKIYFDDNHPILKRTEILEQMLPTLQKAPAFLQAVKSMMGLFHGTPYAKKYKNVLMERNCELLKEFISFLKPLDF